jgi:type IV secretory pathway protease TraF
LIEQQHLNPTASAGNPLNMMSTMSADLDPNTTAPSGAPDAKVKEQITLLRGQLDKKIKALKDSLKALEKKVAAAHNANLLSGVAVSNSQSLDGDGGVLSS